MEFLPLNTGEVTNIMTLPTWPCPSNTKN